MKKLIALVLTLIMVTAVMAGCGDNAAVSSTGSTAGSSSSEKVDSSKNETSESKEVSSTVSGESVEMTLWHMEEPANRVSQIQSVVDNFNASQDDITIKVEVQSWGDAYSEIPAAIMSGNGPDLLATIPDHCAVIYALGVAQDVSGIVDSLSKTYEIYESTITPYVYSDGTYAIPTFGMGQVFWYRKDMFEAKGLEVPQTFEEMLACAETLTDTENDVYGIALPASLSMATDQVIYSFMASANGGSVIDADNNITFNNEGTVAAYDYYAKLLQYSPVDSDTYTWGEPQALLNSGKAAMAIEKGQYLSTFESESGLSADNLGCALMPVLDDSCDSTSIYYSNGFMLLSDDEAKYAATETFFNYLFSEEAYGDFLNAEPGLFVPVTATGAKYESWLSNDMLNKYPTQVETLLEATSDGALFGFTDGVCMDIGKITGPNILAQTLQQMTVNGMSAEEAVAWGEQAMADAIEG